MKTAEKLFSDRFKNEKINKTIIQILKNDRSKGILNFDGEPTKDNIEDIFKQIFEYTGSDKYQIDQIINWYTNDKFGKTSSLENYGRFKDAIKNYKILNDNDKSIKKLHEMDSLNTLEKFIDDNREIIEAILIKREEVEKRKAEMKLLKERGEVNVQIMLDTANLTIYKPTNTDGSKYYGRNTKWCTAGNKDNMFNYYNEDGPIYIIQSKKNDTDKFQLQINSKQLMNSNNESVEIKFVLEHFNDSLLYDWFAGLLYDKYYYDKFYYDSVNNTLRISSMIKY